MNEKETKTLFLFMIYATKRVNRNKSEKDKHMIEGSQKGGLAITHNHF